MRIGILSRKGSLYSTRRLREAAEEHGHEVRVVDPLRCYMDITAKKPRVMFGGEEIGFDAIGPRIGASSTFYGTAVVRQFEMMGAFTVAASDAIARSRDKLRSMQLLAGEGVGLPITGFAHSSRDNKGLISMVGGTPLILKLLEGTQGMGVVLAETRKAAESVIGAFRQLDANILIQEFIGEAQGSDVRAFVVGGRVVAAMERHAAADEFRSNLHRGGTANPVKLTAKERNTAIRAAKVMGLGVSGVDLIRSDRGPLVLEVNSSPGLEGIETTTGVDVAGEIVEFIENNVAELEPSPRKTDRRRRKTLRVPPPPAREDDDAEE
ncbi:MAG TPA: 30S ribosomal protein S6--L-glutamate ligase [Longimicrobiales bacterium]|nr:30S ribosomal protein S6--L-glutamate ligase [Longimicrobiales bacterium]